MIDNNDYKKSESSDKCEFCRFSHYFKNLLICDIINEKDNIVECGFICSKFRKY